MGNLVIKPSNKVNIIYPEVVDVYFAKKVEENGVVKFEKIEKGFLNTLMYIVIETNHIEEGFSLKINVFQYLAKDGKVHKRDTKEKNLDVKVGNYKNKGGTATQAIFEIMLGFDNKNDLPCYCLFSKENRLYVTLSIEANNDEKNYKTICYNLKKYKYNYIDDPNFWYAENRFELENCECCSYRIEDNFLKGHNVIYNKVGSKVSSLGNMKEVKAIILHRTAGSSTAGAVLHSKGTHFYVDGANSNNGENDGEIFQTMGLDKYSGHIRSKTDKTRIARLDIDNDNSIGIEVIGRCFSKDRKGNWKNKPDEKIKITKGYTNYDGIHYWEELTEKQILSVVCIVKKLMEKYNLSKSDILVHEDIQQKTAGEGQAVYDAIISKI